MYSKYSISFLTLIVQVCLIAQTSFAQNEMKQHNAKGDTLTSIRDKKPQKELKTISSKEYTDASDEISTKGEISIKPDESPMYPGGPGALNEFLDKYLIYPPEALALGIEGVVVVTFTVEADGRITGPAINVDKVGHGAADEVKRLLQLMPKWVPGYKQKVPVPVYYSIPVFFKIKK
jgi:periplasmic protein TonB